MQWDKEKISCSERKKTLKKSAEIKRKKSGEQRNTARDIINTHVWELRPAGVQEQENSMLRSFCCNECMHICNA